MELRRPWPQAENLARPENAFDVIESELRLYPNDAAFRTGILGLSRKYDRTPFLQSVQEYAANAAYAKVLVNQQKTDLETGSLVAFGGGILGLHAAVMPLGSERRRLAVMCYPVIAGTADDYDDDSHQAQRTAIYLEHGNALHERVQTFDNHDQMLIMMAAERFCQGYDRAYEDLFIEGVVTSMLGVQAVLRQNRSYGAPC